VQRGRAVTGKRALPPIPPYLLPNRDGADGALSVSKARKKILLARSTVTSTWRSAELRIKLRSVSLSHFSKNVRALYKTHYLRLHMSGATL